MNTTKSNIIGLLKKTKVARRKDLAKLPFPEKISFLVRLQKMANSINKVKGKKQITVWKI